MRIPLPLWAMALMLLGACAGNDVDTQSAEYSAGYSDGCATGSAADSYPRGRVVRNEQAFRHNADYKSGWRAGYNACVVKSGQDPFAGMRDRF